MKQSSIIFKSLLFMLLALCFLASTIGQANALTLNFGLDREYSGGTAPSGSAPWITADFIDVGSNSVQLTMSTGDLTGSENVREWYFNFDSALNLSNLSITANDTSAVDSVTLSQSEDSLKADGDGKYDFMFSFSSSGNQFTSGETVVYDLTYTGGTMDAMSFNFLSYDSGGHGPYYSAAHIQNTGGGGASGWIADSTIVPEPISSTLFIVGGATLGFRRFRKSNKT